MSPILPRLNVAALRRDRRSVSRFEWQLRQRYLDTAHLRAIQDHYLQAIVTKGFSKAVGR